MNLDYATVVTIVKQRLTDGSYAFNVRVTQGPDCIVTFAAISEHDAQCLADVLVMEINKRTVEIASQAYTRIAA